MEHNPDKDVIEEQSVLDSEWVDYALYTAIALVLCFIIIRIASFFPIFDGVVNGLQNTVMLVGLIAIVFFAIKLMEHQDEIDQKSSLILGSKKKTEEILREIEINPLPPKAKPTKHKHSIQETKSTEHKHSIKEVKQDQTLRFTAQILEEVEWLRFEALCSAYFTQLGLKNRLTGLGADGGIDIKIYDDALAKVVAFVQCKKVSNPVSVKLVREFYGVMVSQNITKGYFITSHTFHKGAITFAKNLNIELIDGQALLQRINRLPKSAQASIVKTATLGDYKTASCVKCGTKMKKKLNQKTKQQFWSCPKPRCNTTLQIKTNRK